jgi:hypothetical protein
MSATESFQRVWENYRQSWLDLYTTNISPSGAVERGERGIIPDHIEEHSTVLLTYSEELRNILTTAIETENEDQRDLAALKLVAVSAYDLSVASDLLTLESRAISEEVERGAHTGMLTSEILTSVLNAPLEAGLSSLLEAERAMLPGEPRAAMARLEVAIDNTIKDIPQDVASLCELVVAGIGGLELSLLHGLSTLTQEVIALIPADGISFVVRRAVHFLIEALQKLWASLDRGLQQKAQQQVSNWLSNFVQDQDLITMLLNKLYETERIQQEVVAIVEASPQETKAEQYNRATQRLEELEGRYSKIKTTLHWVVNIVGVVKHPLLGAAPWGPVAVYGIYLGILAYAIYSGGDYLSWYRTEEYAWLPRVQGLRKIVYQALSSTEAI